MKCPVCKEEVNEFAESCPHCQINFSDFLRDNNNRSEKERTNADCLNTMANINIIISIISAILVWVNFSTIKVPKYSSYLKDYVNETVVNWWGIGGGFGILIAGVTLYFLLKTVVDIYKKVEK